MSNKSVKVFLSVIVAVVILAGAVAVGNTVIGGRQPDAVPAGATVAGTQALESTTAAAQPVTLSFLSVGDNLIHDGIYKQANRRAGGNGYDFTFCYERIADTIAAADIATINQETPIAESYDPSGYPLFNSPVELGQEVREIGFDVVNMANNHMLDKTAKGLTESMDFWDNQEGVVRTGAYKNADELDAVEYIERDGMKIGLVGITQYTNGLSLPESSELEILYTSETDAIEQKIKATAAACDAVLVNVHWGSEYTTTPSQDQRNLAEQMASWGADVIIGHHPHVLQPVEWIENEDGSRTLVAYSLGNFISQQNTAARVIGGMLHYDMTIDPQSGSVTVGNVKFETIVTHYVNGSHDVQIYPLSEYTDTLASRQASRIKQSDFSVSYIEEFVSGVIDAEFLAS